MPARFRLGRPLLVAFLGAAGIAGAWFDRSRQRPVQDDDGKHYHDQSFRVARIIDADTLDIDEADGIHPYTRIRLWGVDAPETGQGDKAEMHFGAESTAFARRTLQGRTVHVVLSPNQTRDKYGRLLAYVFLERGGEMFNETLLEEGYAYADVRFAHHYSRQFKEIEKRARRENRGLWAAVTPAQMPEWRQRLDRPQ